MLKRQSWIQTFIFLAGLVLTLVELVMELNSTSLCHSEGCRVVDSFARSEILMVTAGLLFFASLTVLSFFRSFYYGELIIDLLLILAFTVEGYLLGFQAFVVKTFCHFCLVIAAIIFTALLYRLFVLKRINLVVGLFSSLAVFVAVWFVNPFIGILPEARYILIYSENCPHCHKVLEFCKEKGIDVVPVEVREIKGLCRSLGVKSVPALVCSAPDKKEIVIGENQVIKKLSEVFVSEAKANSPIESVTEKEIKKVSAEPKREEKHASKAKVEKLSSVKVKKKGEGKEVKNQADLAGGVKDKVSTELLKPFEEESSGGMCSIDSQGGSCK